MFDKNEYWKRRKAGLRGQKQPVTRGQVILPEEWKKLKDAERYEVARLVDAKGIKR